MALSTFDRRLFLDPAFISGTRSSWLNDSIQLLTVPRYLSTSPMEYIFLTTVFADALPGLSAPLHNLIILYGCLQYPAYPHIPTIPSAAVAPSISISAAPVALVGPNERYDALTQFVETSVLAPLHMSGGKSVV